MHHVRLSAVRDAPRCGFTSCAISARWVPSGDMPYEEVPPPYIANENAIESPAPSIKFFLLPNGRDPFWQLGDAPGLVAGGKPALPFASDSCYGALAQPIFTPVDWLRFQLDN
jgi:hypothetical protein